MTDESNAAQDLRGALEPCPFCGGVELGLMRPSDVRGLVHSRDWFIRCYSCHVETAEYQTKSEAVAAWNRRAALAQPAEKAKAGEVVAMAPIVEWIVELARRDIMREQTDFIGRMHQAMGEFESICDDHPDGDFDEAVRDDAGEALAGLAGLALAQLAMVSEPSDPLSQFAHLPAAEPVGLREYQVETAALAFAKEFYGPGFDPFHNPEAHDLIERGLRVALQVGQG